MKNHWSIFISVIWVIEFLPTKIKCFKCYLNQSNFSKLSVWCARIAFLWACLELPAEMFVRMWEISNNFAQSYAYTGEEKFVWCACGMTENSFRPTILYGLLILKIKTLWSLVSINKKKICSIKSMFYFRNENEFNWFVIQILCAETSQPNWL